MRSATEIHNLISTLKQQQLKLEAERPSASRDAELFRLDGRIQELDRELAQAIGADGDARAHFGGKVVSGARGHDLSTAVLGPRSQFTGIQPGFRAAVTIPANPGVVDPTVPGFGDVPRGFADTLQQGTTVGQVTYLRRGARTNAAAQWATGTKAESTYEWTEEAAPLTWIAHHVPVSKTQASDWGQLDTTIRGELMTGLAQRLSIEALVGANASGITGITNTLNIQEHTIATGDNAYDAIRRMATAVYVNSGFQPTHVAMSPQVAETLDLLKDNTEAYLQVKENGRVWNLEVVEDLGLAIYDTVPVTPVTHHGMIVYSSLGATVLTAETDSIEIGLVNDQFIQNAYTLLAEGRHAFAVRFPDAFCYCKDAIIAVPDA